MLHFVNSILLSLLIIALIGEVFLVKAGRIPNWKSKSLRIREASRGTIDVVGLDKLRTFVCPSYTNPVRRQTNTEPSETITVTMSLEEANQFWQELYLVFEQLGAILQVEGLLSNSPPSSNSLNLASSLIALATQPTPLISSAVAGGGPFLTDQGSNTNVLTTATGYTPFIVPQTSSNIPEVTVSTVESLPVLTTEATLSFVATVPESTIEPTPVISESVPIPVSSPNDENVVSIPSSGQGYIATAGETITTRVISPGVSPTMDMSSSLSAQACNATTTLEQTTTVQLVRTSGTGDVGAEGTVSTTTVNFENNTISTVATSITPVVSTRGNGYPTVTTFEPGHPEATSTSSYNFNSQSNQNIAVYFGQSPATSGTTLEAQCADPSIDIVILAFVISSNYQGKYPGINFGAACSGQTTAMIAEAPGLLYCSELESDIEKCQQIYGKKVLLSLGGAASSLAFATPSDGSDFADILWQLFGPPGNIDPELRPFGNVSIDGFDVDNEDNLPGNYDILASTLRANYGSDPSKSYYLSSAPQCPFPDASNPLDMLLLCDFVFVQFYNNAPCEIGSTNFNESIRQWSSALEQSTLSPKPRLYLGAPAWSAAGPTAYANIGSPKQMQQIAKDVQDMELPNFSGVMFWDGPEGMLNEEDGKDILDWAKLGLAG